MEKDPDEKGKVDPDRTLAFSLMIAGTKCLKATSAEDFFILHENFRRMPLPKNGYREDFEKIIHDPHLCCEVVILAKKAARVNWPKGEGRAYLERRQQEIIKMIKQKNNLVVAY